MLEGDLRLTTNVTHAIEQLAQLESPKLRNRLTELFVNLSAVTALDAPGLLFLTSRIDALRRKLHVRPNGNFPNHPGARRTLADANFPRWLSGKAHRPPPDSSGSLELYAATRHRDLNVRPQIAASIKRFLVATGNGTALKVEEQDMLGWAVQEALENVWTHAYGGQTVERGWQAVGLYGDGTRSVAVVDLGIGIAKTATKGKLPPFADALERLELASKGLLTASGDPKHGKGLSSLVDFCRSGTGRRLHVLSSGGCLVWSDTAAPKKSAIPNLLGTLICLEIDDVP